MSITFLTMTLTSSLAETLPHSNRPNPLVIVKIVKLQADIQTPSSWAAVSEELPTGSTPIQSNCEKHCTQLLPLLLLQLYSTAVRFADSIENANCESCPGNAVPLHTKDSFCSQVAAPASRNWSVHLVEIALEGDIQRTLFLIKLKRVTKSTKTGKE